MLMLVVMVMAAAALLVIVVMMLMLMVVVVTAAAVLVMFVVVMMVSFLLQQCQFGLEGVFTLHGLQDLGAGELLPGRCNDGRRLVVLPQQGHHRLQLGL